MSSEWKTLTLSEIALNGKEGLVDGPFGSALPADSYKLSGVPVIRGSNLSRGEVRFKGDEFVFVSEELAQKLSRANCIPEDIVFTKKGTLGQVGIVPHAPYKKYLLSSNQMRLRVNRDLIRPDFAYYYLSQKSSIDKILRDSEHTGVPKINLAYLRTFPITVPPLAAQDLILAVLKNLDLRIALLRETNATLEAIAQALFKSWFVDFDPVHANAAFLENGQAPSLPAEIQALFPSRLVESPQGVIPEGWEVGVLGDVAETSRKQVKPEQLSSETLYVGLEHIPRKRLGLDAWGSAEELASAKSAFERNDILFGKLRPYFHKVVIAPFEGVCSTDILVCRAKHDSYHHYVAMQLFSDELISYADRLSNGAKMPRINWEDLAAYEVVIPPDEITETFSSTVEPIIGRILANVEKAQTLANLRDTLLPRLISGQLRLPEAEAALAEVG